MTEGWRASVSVSGCSINVSEMSTDEKSPLYLLAHLRTGLRKPFTHRTCSAYTSLIFELCISLYNLGGTASKETIERLCDACTALHNVLSEKDMLGKRFKKRSSVLRVLFRLIDLGSDRLNMTLAKLILGVSILTTGFKGRNTFFSSTTCLIRRCVISA